MQSLRLLCYLATMKGRAPFQPKPWGAAALVWASAWGLMSALEHRVDLANLAMLLVLASALTSLWLPILVSSLVTTGSVLAFDWVFVPPKHAWSIDLRKDALLLVSMLAVSWIIAAVVGRQRGLAEDAARSRDRVQQLHRLSEVLRDSPEPVHQAGVLQTMLAEVLGSSPSLLILRSPLPSSDDLSAVVVLGEPTADEQAGLWQCLRQGQPFGPGTRRYADLPEWYFPMRGRTAAYGAAMVPLTEELSRDDELRAQAQALCDQLGTFLEKAHEQRRADTAREEAQDQQVRNAMLAAISHDYRTPLASIMSAASSLRDQGDRMSTPQRQKLLGSIVEETEQLSRLTDNTLQLARLDAPQGMSITLDWESAEEIVGAVMRRQRARNRHLRLRTRVEPGLPLVRCDALLVTQLLENLIENALKYSDPPAPVELLVHRRAGRFVFAVRDRGYGVEPAWRERIFKVFQRGELQPNANQPRQRSAGVGLAVCRAIARAHGGELLLRPRGHGGSSFEFHVPEQVAPDFTSDAERAAS